MSSMCNRLLALFIGFLLFATPAATQTATLVLPDFCDDPRALFDYLWSTGRGSQALFFMNATGNVTPLINNGQLLFQNAPQLYVSSHGSCAAQGKPGNIGTIPYAQFIEFLAAAHPPHPNNPMQSIYFTACYSQGILSQVFQTYANIDVLTGAPALSALRRINNAAPASLQNATYFGNEQSTQFCDSLALAVKGKWVDMIPQGQAQTYEAMCTNALTQAIAGNAQPMNALLDIVVADFQNLYFALIDCSAGEGNMFQCGSDQGGQPC